MADWYRQLDGRTTGPFSIEELHYLRDRGNLSADDQVRQGVSGAWSPAGSIPRLFPTLRPAVAPATPGQAAGSPKPTEPPDPAPEKVVSPRPPTRVPGQTATPSRSAVAMSGGPVEHDNRDRLLATMAVGAGLAMLMMLLLLLLLWLFWGAAGGSGSGGVASRGGGAGGGSGGGSGTGTGDSNGQGTEADGERARDDSSSSGVSDVESSDDLSPGQGATGEALADEPQEEPSEEPPQDASSAAERPEEDPPPKAAFNIARLPSGDSNAAGGSMAGGAGGGGDFEARLEREGAKSGDVQISLIWNNYNDLDLHVLCPSREELFYQHKRSRCGGELDVDMNAGGRESRRPVENVYWPPGRAPKGKFIVVVNHYSNHGDRDPTRFSVAVKVDGSTREFSGSISRGQPRKLIHEFTRR